MTTEAQQQTDSLRTALNAARGLTMRFGGVGVIARKLAINLNATGDTIIPLEVAAGNLFCTQVLYGNCGVVPTTFTGGVYTAASAGGTNIFAYTRPSAIGAYRQANASVFNLITGDLYSNIAIAEGSAATMDVYLIGAYVPALL